MEYQRAHKIKSFYTKSPQNSIIVFDKKSRLKNRGTTKWFFVTIGFFSLRLVYYNLYYLFCKGPGTTKQPEEHEILSLVMWFICKIKNEIIFQDAKRGQLDAIPHEV